MAPEDSVEDTVAMASVPGNDEEFDVPAGELRRMLDQGEPAELVRPPIPLEPAAAAGPNVAIHGVRFYRTDRLIDLGQLAAS